MTEKIFRMKKGGQGPRGILGRIPFRENTCQCPKARCRAVPGSGSEARECRGRGGRRLAAGRRGSRRRDGRSPEAGAVRSPSLAGSAHIGETLPRCGSVASAKERSRRCGLRAALGGEALRRARGEPSDPAGGNAAALAARPVPGAEKPCCRRESALPARKMLLPAAFPGRVMFVGGRRALRTDTPGDRTRRAKSLRLKRRQ